MTTRPAQPLPAVAQTPVRVLVVDDDEMLGDSLATALESLGHRVRLARTAAAGRSLARETDPEVVVVDLGLPDADGLELLRDIRDQSAVPVLVLTGSADPARRVEALDAGADDFLGKPFRLAELEARLRALSRRPEMRTSPVVSHGPVTIDRAARSVHVDGEPVHLTPIEWRLLDALVSRPGLVVSHRTLIDAGWSDRHGSETVESLRVHVRSLRTKLSGPGGSADRAPIRTESGVGYRWGEPPGPPTARPPVPAARPSGDAAPAGDPADRPERVGAAKIRHDLHNALTALDVATFVLGPEGAAAGVSQAAKESALDRLPRLALRIRELTELLVPSDPVPDEEDS